MPKINTEYTVFVSSPSDVAEERQVVLEVIEEVNKLRAKRSSVTLKALTWENDIMPSFGSKPQEIINSNTSGKYDIFLGFMCARFGTQTDNAGSGTEEEFRIAYKEKMKSPDKLVVMFYFKDARYSKTEIDGKQLEKVDSFKKQLQSSYKGIYGSFNLPEEFRTEITRRLSSILDDFEAAHIVQSDVLINGGTALEKEVSSGITNPLDLLDAICADDSEEGFFELAEKLELATEKIVENLEPITASLTELNRKIRIRTKELTTLIQSGSAKSSEIKKSVNSSALAMEKFVKTSKDTLPHLRLSLEDHIESFRGFLLAIGEENIGNNKEKSELANSVIMLLDSINSAAESLDRFQESVTGLPRMTKRLNLAKREVAAISAGTSKMLMSAHTQLKSLSTSLMQ